MVTIWRHWRLSGFFVVKFEEILSISFVLLIISLGNELNVLFAHVFLMRHNIDRRKVTSSNQQSFTKYVNPFKPSVTLHIETSHLIWLVPIWNATLSWNELIAAPLNQLILKRIVKFNKRDISKVDQWFRRRPNVLCTLNLRPVSSGLARNSN